MHKSNVMAIVFAIFLGACGGGGGGGSSGGASTQDVSVPLQSAVANEVNNGITVNFSVSGTVEATPVTGSGTLKDDKAVAATLNGVAVLKTAETISGTVTANGASTPFSVSRTIFRNPATFAEVLEDLGGPVIVFPVYTYPASVKAGDAATLVTATEFSDNTQTTKTGSVTLAFSVAADTSTSLLVTFIETDFDNNNAKTADAQLTLRIDTMGNIQFVSEKVTGFAVNGQQGSLTFQ